MKKILKKKVNSDCSFDIPDGYVVREIAFDNKTRGIATLDVSSVVDQFDIKQEVLIAGSTTLSGVTIVPINTLLAKNTGDPRKRRGSKKLYIGAFSENSDWNECDIEIIVHMEEYES